MLLKLALWQGVHLHTVKDSVQCIRDTVVESVISLIFESCKHAKSSSARCSSGSFQWQAPLCPAGSTNRRRRRLHTHKVSSSPCLKLDTKMLVAVRFTKKRLESTEYIWRHGDWENDGSGMIKSEKAIAVSNDDNQEESKPSHE